MSSTKRSLVLGVINGLPPRFLEPFALSLRSTGYQGKTCVFAAGYDARGTRELEELIDVVVRVDDDYVARGPRGTGALRFVRNQRGLRRAYPSLFTARARAVNERSSLDTWRNLEYHLEGLQSLRYEHYLEHLRNKFSDADFVLLTDLRDVIFQADPFSDPPAGLELYLEPPAVRVGYDNFNTRWLRDLYGTDFVESVRGAAVSCSGTVVGTREAVIDYAAKMVGRIAWRRRPMGPHDQAAHNALILAGELGASLIVPYGSGRVATVGQATRLEINPDGVLINNDGTVPPIVHQWDRHPAAKSELRALRDVV